jgi:hypothetical protein
LVFLEIFWIFLGFEWFGGNKRWRSKKFFIIKKNERVRMTVYFEVYIMVLLLFFKISSMRTIKILVILNLL